MRFKALRFFAVICGALSLGVALGHALEIVPKLALDADAYAMINGSLYSFYGLVGAPSVLLSIALALALAWRTRGTPAVFELALLAGLCFALALVLWFAVVAPVNAEVELVLRERPDAVPAVWSRWRERWEYGHLASCVFVLGGFGSLVLSILEEPPRQG